MGGWKSADSFMSDIDEQRADEIAADHERRRQFIAETTMRAKIERENHRRSFRPYRVSDRTTGWIASCGCGAEADKAQSFADAVIWFETHCEQAGVDA